MNDKINKYIEFLSFFHLDQNREFWHPNFIACNTQNQLASTNRVFITNNIREEDLTDLKKYYGHSDFTFWLNEFNEIGNSTLVGMGSTIRFSYPIMLLKLKQLTFLDLNQSIHVKQLSTQQEILSLWAPLVANAYGKIELTEFKKFISYLLSTDNSKDICFYIACLFGEPCATSMIIKRDNVCDIHWVGTIPTFRNKGAGFAVTLQPLLQLKEYFDEAILFASDMGKPIYEKMGFNEICKINVYNSV